MSTYGIQSIPAILHFNSVLLPVGDGGGGGARAKLPTGYNGDASPYSLVRFALQSVDVTNVERVHDEHSLAHFLTLYSGYDMPKFLYVSEKVEKITSKEKRTITQQRGGGAAPVPPLFRILSQTHRYGGCFGVTSAVDSPLVEKLLNVTVFPSLLSLSTMDGEVHIESLDLSYNTTMDPTSGDDNIKEADGSSSDRQEAALRQQMISFLEQRVLSSDSQASIREAVISEEHKKREKAKEQAKFSKATPPRLITNRKDWKEQCLQWKRGICLAVFMDSSAITSSSSRGTNGESTSWDVEMEALYNVTKRVSTKTTVPLQLIVLDGTANYKLAAALGIVNGLPDAVAFFQAKRKVFKLVGSVNERGLTNFILDKVVKGVGGKDIPKKVPKFVEDNQKEKGDEGDTPEGDINKEETINREEEVMRQGKADELSLEGESSGKKKEKKKEKKREFDPDDLLSRFGNHQQHGEVEDYNDL